MLNRMQQAGFERAKKWWADGNEQIFKIAGYAGTGKTYLSSVIAEELADNRIAFCAYTGKAALVSKWDNVALYDVCSALCSMKRGNKKVTAFAVQRWECLLEDYVCSRR